jgi:hypothetical protein
VKTPDTDDSDAPQVTTGFNSYSIDLSGIAELSNLTSAVTFQFEYFTDAVPAVPGSKNWRFDNIYLYGASSVLPPTSIDEFAIGMVDGTNVVLSWQGNPAGTYIVQRKLNLVYDTVWSNVVENIQGVSGTMSVTNDTSEPKAFYRTILAP